MEANKRVNYPTPAANHGRIARTKLAKIMTKEILASKLNGREYREEITHEECKLAKENGLLVIFGASDDLVEFRGAFDDEDGCCGGTVRFTRNRIFPDHSDCECQFCGYKEAVKKSNEVTAVWDQDGYSWQYLTSIPHATFEIVEGDNGDEKYCRGIVISVNDLKP